MLERAFVVATLVAASLAACGGESSAPAESETTERSATTTAPRNPVPADLVGTWRMVDGKVTDVVRLSLRPNGYTVSRGYGHTGQVEARGKVLTFTSVCGGTSTTGTGRYRWTLDGDTLHLELVGEDECSGRTDVLEDATYERSG